MPVATEKDVRYNYRVAISMEALDAYENYAHHRGIDLEDVLSQRLETAKDQVSQKPLYFSDEDRQKLEVLLGRNITNPKDALAVIARALTVRVNGTTVALKPDLLGRLQSRCFEPNFEKWLSNLIRVCLEQFVGVR